MKRGICLVFIFLLFFSYLLSVPLSTPTYAESSDSSQDPLMGTTFDWPGPLGTEVDMWDGSLTLSRTEAELPGRVPIMIAFSYHSNLYNVSSQYGYGWRFAHNVFYVENDTEIIIVWGNGGAVRFQEGSDSGYVAPSGVSDTLEEYSPDKLVLTTKDGFSFFFDDNEHKHVTKVVDRCGNAILFSYDRFSFLTTITDDQSSFSTSLHYDDLGRLKWVHLPNKELAFTYDDEDNLIRLQTLNPNTFETILESSYEYDENHLLTAISDPQGKNLEIEYTDGKVTDLRTYLVHTTFVYDQENRITSISEQVDQVQQNMDFCFDEEGRCQLIIDSLGNEVVYEWDENNIIAVTDQKGHTTRYLYDSNRNPTSILDAMGNWLNYTYDSATGKITSITNKKGNTWNMFYDAAGNLARRTDPLGNNVTYQYNSFGDLLRVDYPIGYVTFSYYDSGLVSSKTYSTGYYLNYTYDAAGNLDSISDSSGNYTLYEYDALGQIVSFTNRLGQKTLFEYDAYNNLVTRVDAKNASIEFEYDELDRVIRTVDALGNETLFDYNSTGNSKTITDALGRTTVLKYDSLGRLIQEIDALGNTTSYAYDEVDNIINMTDKNGETTYFEYDALNRLILIDYPDDSDVHYSYDSVGNLISLSNSNATINYEYDPLNRLSKVNDATHNKNITYVYDGNGNLVQFIDPFGKTTNYTYDQQDRLLSIIDPLNRTTSFIYNQLGRLVEKHYPNGISAFLSHNAVGATTSLVYKNSTDDVIMSYEYEYDVLGNKVSTVELDGSTTLYAYDLLSRLVKVIYPDASFEEFTYDAVGNRLKLTSSSGTIDYVYDDTNRLVSAGGTVFEWDKNGNLIAKTDVEGETTYSYDYADRLKSIICPDGTSIDYDFYPDGTILCKKTDGTPVCYIYNGPDVLYEVDEFWDPIVEYNTIVMDNRVSMEQDGDSFFYIYDHIGSVVGLTDVNGELVSSYRYSAFGTLRESTGDVPNSNLYIGREYDENSNLYNFRARFYDPVTGRFLSKDPLLSDLTLYSYAANDPVNLADPTGLVEGAYSPPAECCDPEFYNEFRQFVYTPTTLKEKREIWEDIARSGKETAKGSSFGQREFAQGFDKWIVGKWMSGLISEMEWVKKNYKEILWGTIAPPSIAGSSAVLTCSDLAWYGNSAEPFYLTLQSTYITQLDTPAGFFTAKGAGGFHLGFNKNYWLKDFTFHVGLPEHVEQTRFGQQFVERFGPGKMIQGTRHYFPVKRGAQAALLTAFFAAPYIGVKGCDRNKEPILPDPDAYVDVDDVWMYRMYLRANPDPGGWWDETIWTGTMNLAEEEGNVTGYYYMTRLTIRHNPDGSVNYFGPFFVSDYIDNGTLTGNKLHIMFHYTGPYNFIGLTSYLNWYGTCGEGVANLPWVAPYGFAENVSEIRVDSSISIETIPDRIEPRYGPQTEVTAAIINPDVGGLSSFGGPISFENLTPELAVLSNYIDLGPQAKVKVNALAPNGTIIIRAQTPHVLQQEFEIEISPTSTWYVGGDNADFATIQEAINTATPRDTVYVWEGTYHENVLVNKTIRLVGEGYDGIPIIDGDNSGNTITVTANGVTIEGFEITNSSENYQYSGIFLDNVNNTNINSNTIHNNHGNGIFVIQGSNNTLAWNEIFENGAHGLRIEDIETNATVNWNYVYGNLEDGFFISDAQNILVDGNEFSENVKNGITLQRYSHNITINDNYLWSNQLNGLFAYESTNISVYENYFDSNGQLGIYFSGSNNNTINNNELTNDSLYLRDSFENVVEGNTVNSKPLAYLENAFNQTIIDAGQVILVNSTEITLKGLNLTDADFGLELWLSHDCVIMENLFQNNLMGIVVANSSGNIFYHNQFVNNTMSHIYVPSYAASSINTWDSGYPEGGNYWDDYSGVDLYSGPYQNETGSDGIGDTPYVIDSNNQDNYPFMVQTGRKDTIIHFFLAPNPSFIGQTVTLQGNLTDSLGNPINNTEVYIYLNGTYRATLFTNSSGWFTASAPVNTPGTYGITVAYNGSDTYNPSIHDETLMVYLTLDTKIEFTLSPNPATVGQTITLQGNLTDIGDNPIGNAPVELYVKVGSGPWQLQGTLTTNSTGWFQASGKINSAGTFQVAVVYWGTSKYNMSYKIKTLTINP